MPQLSLEGLKNKSEWSGSGIKVPDYDLEAVKENTNAAPIWVHFGAGNIFRGFIARLQNTLLNEGLSDKGIIAAETFDHEIIDKIYRPFDNLT
ncbi:MAG: mannitol dehydrogenase family protein, partial [Clostridiales bacterium]|nr:mannitol dehydrogenase family protein [Clostridiales bacterium]